MRFIQEEDYNMQIKQEIIKLLAGDDFYNSYKLIRAETTAKHQMQQYIGKRYDLAKVFEMMPRDEFIVTILIDMTLYHLYSQTGSSDLSKHRSIRYQDALDWLKDVGNGSIPADLPLITDCIGKAVSEFKIWSARPAENHKW